MIKRQSSSSSRPENQPENLHAKTIGCMSGVFQFLYNYRSRRKLLTSGKKHDAEKAERHSAKIQPKGAEDVLRSPTLPAEIRTPPSTVVTRLMGVDYEGEDSAEEKRRKLLGALERCDEELKAVKRIIDVVRRSVSGGSENEILGIGTKLTAEEDVSVSQATDVYALNTSKLGGTTLQQQQHKEQYKKPPEKEINDACLLRQKKPREEEIINGCLYDRFRRDWLNAGQNAVTRRAMVESVNQVCSDIAWGERRELGRIGLALQDHICRDLIDEIVKELGSHPLHSLPFEACKRRLRF